MLATTPDNLSLFTRTHMARTQLDSCKLFSVCVHKHTLTCAHTIKIILKISNKNAAVTKSFQFGCRKKKLLLNKHNYRL